MKGRGKKKFDFIIGNPPYQEEMEGTSDNPVYNYYMDSVYDLADKVELISPARFLFNAGKTPKEWNRKMLNDPHLKVLEYWPDSDSVFPGTDIKGGVAITYHDSSTKIGPIKYFIPNEILRQILNKVKGAGNKTFNTLVRPTEYYKLSQKLHEERVSIQG